MYRSSLLTRPHAFTAAADGDLRHPNAQARLIAALQGRQLAMLDQIHGADVRLAGDGHPAGDALIALDGTHPAGTVVAVRVADCVPILLEGPGAVAAVHAGWRGTAAHIARRAVERLRDHGVDPASLRAAIGPAIGPCCYEVGPEVIDALAAAAVAPGWRQDRQVDLRALNRDVLASLGVTVEIVGPCTRCTPALWSHRRDPAHAGRQAGAIRL